MKLVKIVKPWSLYNPGEQAGFEDATAQKLVKEGIAELVEAPAAAEAGDEGDGADGGGVDTDTAPKAAAKPDKKAAAAAALPGQGVAAQG